MLQSQTNHCLNDLALCIYSFLREKENEHFMRYKMVVKVQEEKGLAGVHMK